MKKTFLLMCSIALTIFGSLAQTKNGVTIKIEDLTKPDKLLPVVSYQSVLEGLIHQDRAKLTTDATRKATPQYQIVAQSNIPQALVNRGYHSFFEGVYAAYADHRPYTISPDMIWLVISQGFAYHVNNNSEELRKMFANFDGKTTLLVQDNDIKLDDPNSPWDRIFQKFSAQIASHTGKELTDAMTADFSTTTQITKIASQITLMNAMKSYFDFMVMMVGCGIPEITLEGTPQDWQRVLAKTKALRKYKLDWWIDELEPILTKIVRASKGEVDKDFWCMMFKNHNDGKCGIPATIDGWIVKFYPYNKEGKRNDLKTLKGTGNLPNEIVKVDLEHVALDKAGNSVSTPLELWAGFVGLEQNDKTFGLKPVIGWMIRKKDNDNALVAKLKSDNNDANWWGGIKLRIKTVPPELYAIGTIHKLTLSFIDDINIPDQLANVKIDQLYLSGKITVEENQRIKGLFPNTELFINQ